VPRGRDFRLLLAARTVSMFGTTMATIAVPFAVLEISGSATDVGLVLGSKSVAEVLLILFGGVIADRMPRQRLMVMADTVAASAQAACAVLLLSGDLSIPVLAVLQAVGGGASAFFFPASQAVIPEVVEHHELPAANAALRSAINGAAITGGAVGGLVAAASVGGALALDAASFAASAVCCLLIAGAGVIRERGPSIVAELREGWAAFRATRWLWVVVVQFALVNLAFNGAFYVLGPVQADEHLGGASAWGVVVAAWSLGLLLGAVVSFRLRTRRAILAGEVGMLASALPVLALIGPTPTALIAATAFAAGLGCEIFGVQWSTALHRHVPPERLARLTAYDALGSFALIPAGVALAGPAADAFGMEATLLGAAVLVAGPTIAAILVRDVRDLPSIDLRGDVARAARTLAEAGLVAEAQGNVSAREGDRVYVTGTGVRLADATPAGVSVVGLDGTLHEGPPPSSELKVHLGIYAAFPDTRAVVHGHVIPSDAAHPVAPHAAEGSQELADNVVAAMRDGAALVVMERHGTVARGADLADALRTAAAARG
jgi:MFS family permease